jgi:hypothetical protein
MLIENVEVRCFRTIRSVNVSFTRGLNVIHGDNDVGKSTLMEAIRACLTLRARGTAKKYASLRPRDGGDPEVRVAFRKDAVVYSVHKRFGTRGTTHLNVRPDTGVASDFSGDEAEHQLRRILGLADDAARGAPDLGVLPVLWVDQGTSRDLPTLEGQGATILSERLRALSGEVIAGGKGEAIFSAVETSYNETFTSRGPRAGSALQRAHEAREQAEEQLTTLRGRHAALETTAARLDDVGVRLRSVQGSIPALLAGVGAAEGVAQAARDGLAALARAESEVGIATVLARAASERHERRVSDRAQVGPARARVDACRAAVSAAHSQLVQHDSLRVGVEERVAETVAQDARLRGEATEAQRAVTRIESARTRTEIDARIARARTYEAEQRDATQRAEAEPITDAKLIELERLARAADLACAALETSATTIAIRAVRQTQILLDEVQVDVEPGCDVTRTVTAPTTLHLADLQIEVSPGGADLEKLRARAFAAHASLKEALETVRATDLREARTRAAARVAAVQQADVAAQVLRVTAPDGVASLETMLDELAEADGEVSPELHSDAALSDARGVVSTTLTALEDAARAAADARSAQKAFEGSRDRLNGDVRVANEALSGATDALDRIETELAASVAGCGTDDDLASAHASALAGLRAVEAKRDELVEQLPPVSLAEAEQRLGRARRTLQSARDEETKLSNESYRLEVDLQAPDAIGLDDRLAGATVRLDEATSELQRLSDRAEALRWLYELLRDERTAARKRFLAPLAREVQPLLSVLYPGSRIELDENFAITRLERAADGAHDFDALGGGSQEQLSILVRLAMARVLGGGAPMPVMLDDAIVFTSETRFARMADVLLAAATNLQLLVFTCHWPRYRELGPDHVVDLEAAKNSAPSQAANEAA